MQPMKYYKIPLSKGIANFRGEAALYTWMHWIATNESLTFCKQQQKRTTIAFEDAPEGACGRQSTTGGLEGSAITQLLQQALATLPQKQQQVFQITAMLNGQTITVNV